MLRFSYSNFPYSVNHLEYSNGCFRRSFIKTRLIRERRPQGAALQGRMFLHSIQGGGEHSVAMNPFRWKYSQASRFTLLCRGPSQRHPARTLPTIHSQTIPPAPPSPHPIPQAAPRLAGMGRRGCLLRIGARLGEQAGASDRPNEPARLRGFQQAAGRLGVGACEGRQQLGYGSGTARPCYGPLAACVAHPVVGARATQIFPRE